MCLNKYDCEFVYSALKSEYKESDNVGFNAFPLPEARYWFLRRGAFLAEVNFMNHHVFAVIQTSLEVVSDLVSKGKEGCSDAVNFHPTRCAIKIDTRGDSESSKGVALTGARTLSEGVKSPDSITAFNAQDNLFYFAFSLGESEQGAPRGRR
ncbi:hypothetical protein VCHA34P120_70043 [Vibrio chagasii]|nr:hypothetical protein VCHA34P120_70043 [Vibrio chagasii]